MDLQEGPRLGGDGLLVVAEVGPVGRANLHEGCAGLSENVRDAKTAADLHCLAPGDDDLTAGGDGGEGKEHGCGVVVYGEGRLGAGQLAEEGLDVLLAGAASAVVERELQVRVALSSICDGV